MSDELPQGWVAEPVGEIFSSHGGGTPNRGTADYWNGNIPWLSSGDIKAASISDSSETITKRGLEESSARLCRKGSVIVVVRSGILKHTLPVALLERDAAINQDIKAFDSGDDNLNHWLAFAWRASARKLLAENREGTTVQSVKFETLRDFVLPIPPLAEQRRIVAKLEKLLGQVDACQQRLAKIPVLLKRFRQSLLAAACSGRLTADWREENQNVESARLLVKRLDEQAEFLESDDLPSTWTRCQLKSLTSLITKGASPKWQGINYAVSGVLFVTSENVGNGEMLLRQKKFVEPKINEIQPRSVLKKGDVLTNLVGASIGRSAIYELDEVANTNQAVGIIRLKPGVENRYLLHVLNSPVLVDHIHAEKVDVARANVSLADVRDFPIPIAPLAEQQEIVRRVAGLFALADQLEQRLAQARKQVDKLTPSLLARAFAGQLVLQDPTDEPAEKLLQRIRQLHQPFSARRSGG